MPPSAANRVLHIPELLDNILLNCDLPTLHTLPLVSRHLHAHLTTSLPLLRHLWLHPDPTITVFRGNACPRPNPHLWPYHDPKTHPRVDLTRYSRREESGFWRIHVEMWPDEGIAERTRLGYGWRRMLAAQPCGEGVVFDVVVWFKGREERYQARGLKFGRAPTFGELAERCYREGVMDDGTARTWF